MISFINGYLNSYHEVHEEHKDGNQKIFVFIFVQVRVLFGDKIALWILRITFKPKMSVSKCIKS